MIIIVTAPLRVERCPKSSLLSGGCSGTYNRTYFPTNLCHAELKCCIYFSSTEVDEGESLNNLLQAKKDLFQNNFLQVVLAHAAGSIAANYDLIVGEFDGCATPVLKGHPVSGKTTALKEVMSVFR